jgi:hypothetical protein
MTRKDQIFIANVMVTNSMREMVVLNVINPSKGVTTKFSAIVKIHKYKRLHDRHYFIPMAMEVHGAPRCDMDRFIKVHARFSMINDQKVIYLFFLHSIFQSAC